MWLLEEVAQQGETQGERRTFTFCARSDGEPAEACVGRKQKDPAPSAGNILLENQSISREHAAVRCDGRALTVIDKSKFGTFVNDQRVAKGEPHALCQGDQLRFGTVATAATFRVSSQPVAALCSSVGKANKRQLQKMLPALGGEMLSSWGAVTHLVQDKIVMTEKAMLALIEGVPIVTHEWFAAVLARGEAVTPLPNLQAYLPDVSQGTTQSVSRDDFHVKPERKTMLAGHLFFFFTDKQHKKHSKVITQAGGEAVVVRSAPPHSDDVIKRELDARGSARPAASKLFFIDVESASQLSQGMSTDEAEAVAAARERCAEHGVRKIRDTEVLQAILRCELISEVAEPAAVPSPAAAPAAAAAASAAAAAPAPAEPAKASQAAGTAPDPERPVPAVSRRRTTAPPSPASVTEEPAARPRQRRRNSAAASRPAEEAADASASSAAAAEGEEQEEQEEQPPAAARGRSGSGARRRLSADMAPDAADGAPQGSAQLDDELESRLRDGPPAEQRRKAPPLSSTWAARALIRIASGGSRLISALVFCAGYSRSRRGVLLRRQRQGTRPTPAATPALASGDRRMSSSTTAC